MIPWGWLIPTAFVSAALGLLARGLLMAASRE